MVCYLKLCKITEDLTQTNVLHKVLTHYGQFRQKHLGLDWVSAQKKLQVILPKVVASKSRPWMESVQNKLK